MLVLHAHPLSSFCMKVEMALYERGDDFRLEHLDLADPAVRERFQALWALGKMPVLQDTDRGETVPETSIIVEYLEASRPARASLIPKDRDLAWRVRFWDRFYDLHVQGPMQRFSEFRRSQAGARDEAIAELVPAQLGVAYGVIEAHMAERQWSAGDDVTLADCAAAPALFYADRIVPLKAAHPWAAAYLDRLKARPSFARVLQEAEPYLYWVPF